VVLAVINTFRRAWWERLMLHSHLLLSAGVLTTGSAMWLFSERFGHAAAVVGFPLLSLGLALIVASAAAPNGLLAKLRGFGWLAALAYSLYLTHKEIVHLDFDYLPSLTHQGGWLAPVTYFVTSFAAAAALYLCIERPFLKWRERLSARGDAVQQAALAEAR
jgi:peptidoglycan/LPS O-acetylase OafA/YrhL